MKYMTLIVINHLQLLVLWFLQIRYTETAYLIAISNTNISRVQRHTRCSFGQFVCRDGSCITDGLQCNGVDNCIDGSDETNECKYIPCNPFYGYQCDYGACVQKNARCNGITECKDSSDERGCIRLTPTFGAQTSCADTKFSCKSGECIDNAKLCDGHADCADNSDETSDCAMFSCTEAYRCKYGACAVKDARCNGVRDCFDGSDEQGCSTSGATLESRLSFDSGSDSCMVPKVPRNGIFLNSNNKEGAFRQGDYAPNLHALVTKCDRSYKITPPNRSYPVCIDGKWTSPAHECARVCQNITPSKTMSVSCSFNGTLLDSCEDPVEGTSATIKCQFPYEYHQQSTNKTVLCRNGTWNYPVTECQPSTYRNY